MGEAREVVSPIYSVDISKMKRLSNMLDQVFRAASTQALNFALLQNKTKRQVSKNTLKFLIFSFARTPIA